MIPGTHLEGPNELTIQDNKGNVLWKKLFDSVGNDHQVCAIYPIYVILDPRNFYFIEVLVISLIANHSR